MKTLTGAVLCVVLTLTLSSFANAADGVAELKAKLATEIDANGTASAEVKAFAKETLVPLCTNPIFVSQVKAQNVKGVSLDDIKKLDEEWINAEDELPLHILMLSNPCSEEITKLSKSHSAIGETFVADNQGANVGQNDLTSDYWQGDEGKWKNAFNNGDGGVDIGEEKFDKSANMVTQQVSLPIINEDGSAIGTITFGILVDKL